MSTFAVSPSVASTDDVAQASAEAYKAQRLNKAAHQFEAMLLGEMLKPLTKTDEDALSGTESGSSPLQSFGMEAVAGSLANSNALGFAKQIEKALQGRQTASQNAAADR